MNNIQRRGLSNYQRKVRLVLKAIRANFHKQTFNFTQLGIDVESLIAKKYGDVVSVDVRMMHDFVGTRDMRIPHIQEDLSHEVLKHLWVHSGLDLNKRESK